uniref:Uncharacterized protein n=1 Tax=Phalansterium sp. PJK-2012 TaxID=1267188 RepID=T1QE23_9EUKA|nr:hypothetical protein [Phalansterium sp. PJK-2012]
MTINEYNFKFLNMVLWEQHSFTYLGLIIIFLGVNFLLSIYFFKFRDILAFTYRCAKKVLVIAIVIYSWITLAKLRRVITRALTTNIKKLIVDKNLSIYKELAVSTIIVFCAFIYSCFIFICFHLLKQVCIIFL